jgi:hypothetical protein
MKNRMPKVIGKLYQFKKSPLRIMATGSPKRCEFLAQDTSCKGCIGYIVSGMVVVPDMDNWNTVFVQRDNWCLLNTNKFEEVEVEDDAPVAQ